ncbi:MAG: multidrug efflux MFS transporter [Chloroflexi bacterium]|nr:multidrug efflux MFS transporter [Chloroflexota bacterium]
MKSRAAAAPWERNLTYCALAEVLIILSSQASFNLIPYYIQQMGLTEPRAVTAYTAAYQSVGLITFAIFTPIWGMLSDRYGRKPLFMRAIAATCVTCAMMALARTPGQLMAARVVQGCMTGTPTAASVLVATGTPRHRRAYALGLVQTAVSVGVTIGPMIGGVVADTLSYRATYWGATLLVFIALVIVALRVTEPEDSEAVTAQARSQHPLVALKDLGRSRPFVLLLGITLALNLAISLQSPVIPIYIQQLVGSTDRIATVSGLVTGLAGLTMAGSALLIGRAIDRIGARTALLASTWGTAALYVPLAFNNSIWGLGLLQAIQGACKGGISPGISTLVVNRTRPEKIGVALGLNTSASSTGSALGPLVGAAIFASLSVRAVFIASALLCLVTIAGLRFVDDRPDADLV